MSSYPGNILRPAVLEISLTASYQIKVAKKVEISLEIVNELPLAGWFLFGNVILRGSKIDRVASIAQVMIFSAVWDKNVCIQCGKCSMICLHATIRIKVYDEKLLENAPKTFKSSRTCGRDFPEGSVSTLVTLSFFTSSLSQSFLLLTCPILCLLIEVKNVDVSEILTRSDDRG